MVLKVCVCVCVCVACGTNCCPPLSNGVTLSLASVFISIKPPVDRKYTNVHLDMNNDQFIDTVVPLNSLNRFPIRTVESRT